MNISGGFSMVACVAALLCLAGPASSSGPHGHSTESAGGGGHSMNAQHERMANFREGADMLCNAIIHGAGRMALDGAEKIEHSLAGHEGDVPHKNRSRAKEFHGLFAELGKRTLHLKKELRSGDLARGAVLYGRVLETCATCHGKFRD